MVFPFVALITSMGNSLMYSKPPSINLPNFVDFVDGVTDSHKQNKKPSYR